MIILGDLACPNSGCAEQLIADMRKCGIFKNQLVLCNLEGMIRDDEPYKDEKLFNHSKVLDAFEKDKTVFSLANNHTYDYPEYIISTQKLLIQNGFYNVGIGEVSPILVESENNKYAVFAHCWSVYTKTNSNTINDVIVTDCDYKTFAEVTVKFAKEHPEVRVVCYFHWNYDMEKIPFPAYRRLAHDLIDGGVYSVIGNHSHVPQGGEIYKNRAIVYGLGNFYIPSGWFFDRKLNYPAESKIMMALELPENTDIPLCHWFKTDCNALEYICSENFENGSIIATYSKYKNMDESAYLSYFRQNRVKKHLVPIFVQYSGVGYDIKERLAVDRIRLIKALKNRIRII